MLQALTLSFYNQRRLQSALDGNTLYEIYFSYLPTLSKAV